MSNELVIALIGSSGMAALISGVFNIIINRKKAKDGVRAGVRILLYDRIKHLGGVYIARGWLTQDELEDLIHMHGIYHNDLGGNGYLDDLMVKVKALTVKNNY